MSGFTSFIHHTVFPSLSLFFDLLWFGFYVVSGCSYRKEARKSLTHVKDQNKN